MPSLKDIRRRIGSVRSTQKITRAMKLVSAAKLRRAQDNVVRVRPYSAKLREVVQRLVVENAEACHPLLAVRAPKQVLILLFTSDRGLCGAFNINVLRRVEAYREAHAAEHEAIHLAVIGRKGRSYLRFRQIPMAVELAGLDLDNVEAHTQEISRLLSNAYLGRPTGETALPLPQLDRVLIVYNEFRSALSQHVRLEQLLPIVGSGERPSDAAASMIYEPNQAELLNHLLPMYIEQELYRASAEVLAAEYGARMSAMGNATKNASEMISSLTLQYNKARQSAITKELLEIVGGAEALRAQG